MLQMCIQTFIRLFLQHLVGNSCGCSFIRHLNKLGFAFLYLCILKLWPSTFLIGIFRRHWNFLRMVQEFFRNFNQNFNFESRLSYYLLWLVVVAISAIANVIKVITRYRMLRLLLVERVIKLSSK